MEFIFGVEFFKPLGAEALACLARAMEIEMVEPGDVLVCQGKRGDAMYVVVSGMLRAFVRRQSGEVVELGRIGASQPVGEMQFVGGGTPSATVQAVTRCTVYKLRHTLFDSLPLDAKLALSQSEVVHARLHRSHLAVVLPKIFGPLDMEVIEQIEQMVEWVNLERGQALFHQGDEYDGWYLVLTGRLRVVVNDAESGKECAVAELGQGDSLGEIAMITGEQRNATPYALRDSLLVRFPVKAFENIMQHHPKVLLSICRTLVMQSQNKTGHSGAKSRLVIAVVPAGDGKLAPEFSRALQLALERIGTALHVNARTLTENGVLDAASGLLADHPNWMHFSSWLEEQQLSHDFIVLETDTQVSGWTQRALGQADHVIFVGDAGANRALGEIEERLLPFDESTDVRRARRTLVLVHAADTLLPGGTREWLALRRVDRHLHVRAGCRQDCERVARMVTGRAVGLALGGGGARGFAHFGVVKALQEQGIAIDVLGGTSMGAIVAAQLASGRTLEQLHELNRRLIAFKPFSDYTIPMVAMLKSAKIIASARMAFGETHIEDLWLPYFAVSSNLTTGEMVVHVSGPVWEAVCASGALPGIVMPVVMGEHLLVDGGVVNILPGDVMRAKCDGGVVIAVDVSPEKDVGIDAGGFPSPWKIFWSRVLPFKKRKQVPGILDILMRTTMLASANRTARVKRSVDLYLRPPIDNFGMLDFEKMSEIVEVGYRYTLEAAAGWTPPENRG